MKRGKRDFKLSNRWLYTFIILGIFAVVGVGVYAYGTSSPSTFGHSAGEIDFSGGIVTASLSAQSNGYPGVEIRSLNGGTPYIDFSNAPSDVIDYNARIILTGGNILQFVGEITTTGGITTNALDSINGYYSSGNIGGTGNAAYFPYGLYSIGPDNWIYGTTYLGNAGDTINFRTNTITGTGSIYAGAFIYSSDESLKANVTLLNNALEKVKQLEGVSFNWKNTGRADIGLIAQDVEKVIPEIVHTNEEGLKSVEYGNLVAILIEAVKEQQEEIDSLQKQIDELRN
jgi:hypothetical protein